MGERQGLRSWGFGGYNGVHSRRIFFGDLSLIMPAFVLIVFLVAYIGFAIFSEKRSWIAVGAAGILLLTGAIGVEAGVDWVGRLGMGLQKAFVGHGGEGALVSWNVMGLFFGMLVLAELFLESRAPAVIAEKMLASFSSARGAMIALCALAGAISVAVENVAVVLLLAPIALSLAKKLGVRAAPLLIGISICSNVQGTATMIGDPPSMILAGEMKMDFFDFFVYHGRAGIFFAVEVGAILSLLVLGMFFRRYRGAFELVSREKARSWVPTIMLVVLIAGLSVSSVIDPDFSWFAGTLTMGMGALAFAWNAWVVRWVDPKRLFRSLDWDTTLFLIAVFVLVGGLSGSGWLEVLSKALSEHVGGSLVLAFVVIVLLSAVISGFVDNVPFLLAMIPVVQQMGDQMHGVAPHAQEALLFGLLIGACMGGNLTPIGASANVTTLGILRKNGEAVSFREFMGISLPFTLAAVVGSAVFVWFVWA